MRNLFLSPNHHLPSLFFPLPLSPLTPHISLPPVEFTWGSHRGLAKETVAIALVSSPVDHKRLNGNFGHIGKESGFGGGGGRWSSHPRLSPLQYREMGLDQP